MTTSGRGGVRLRGLLLVVVLAATPVHAASEAAVDLRVTAAPISVTLELSRTTTSVGKPITAKATVHNAGARKLVIVTVALRVDVTGLLVAKGGTGSITGLKGGKSGGVQWTVCGASPGSYVLLVRATVDGVNVDSPAQLLVVTPGKAKC